MRSTGIVRQIDEVGRVVLPKEFREIYGMGSKDSVEILSTDDGLLLKKYIPGCDFCNGFDNLHFFKSKKVCAVCRKEIIENG